MDKNTMAYYNPRNVVGEFFEQKTMRIFNLSRSDGGHSGKSPDLVSKDGSFYVEVKASAYDNGGVINKNQIYRFEEEIKERRFYAFPFHSITKDMSKRYSNPTRLITALDLRSLYLFPFSIVLAHFENSEIKTTAKHDGYVQLNEERAKMIFGKNAEFWNHLGLNPSDYKMKKLHEKVFVVTKDGYLEDKIACMFHPKSI